MANENRKYVITVPGYKPSEVNADEFDRNKDRFFTDYPDAQVMSTESYDPKYEYGDNDSLVLNINGYKPTVVNAKEFQANSDRFFKDYPDAQVNRVRSIRNEYFGQQAQGIQDRLNEFNKENGEFIGEYEKQGKIASNISRPTGREHDAYQFLSNNTDRYEQLINQRDAIAREYLNNPLVREMYSENEQNALELAKHYREQASQANGLGEKKRYLEAAKMQEDRAKVYAAPGVDADDITFKEYLSKYGKGMGREFTDVDNLVDVTAILRKWGIPGMFEKVADSLEADGKSAGDITDEDIQRILTPSEAAKLVSFMSLSKAENARAYDTSSAYNAGRSAAESINYMVQFWLAEKAMGKIGERLMVRGAEKAISKWAARMLASEGSDLAKATSRVGWAGKLDDYVVKPIVKGMIHTATQPATVSAVQDYLCSIDDDGHMMDTGKAILKGVADSFIENWSEGMGKFAEDALGFIPKKIGQAAKWKLGDTNFYSLARYVVNRPTAQVLKNAGFNGFIGEMGEEWIGNAARVAVGLMSAEEFKDWARLDSQLEMAASFGPMSIFGLATNSVGAVAYNKMYKQSSDNMRHILERAGASPKQIQAIFDKKYATVGDVKDALSPWVGQIAMKAKNSSMSSQASIDYEETLRFANLLAGHQTLNEVQQMVQQGKRDALTEEIRYRAPGAISDKVSPIRVDGKEGFIVHTSENGDMFLVEYLDGTKEFVTAGAMDAGEQNGTIVRDAEQDMNDYLDKQIEKREEEGAELRRQTAQQQMLTDFRSLVEEEAAKNNGRINIGTEDAPEWGTVMAESVNVDGLTLEVETPEGNRYQYMTWGDIMQRKGQQQLLSENEQNEKDANTIAEGDVIRRRVNRKCANDSFTHDGKTYIFNRIAEANTDGTFNAYVTDEDGYETTIELSRSEVDAIEKNHQGAPTASAEGQETNPAQDSRKEPEAGKDIHGNPLPMSNGVVDEKALYNSDPEAWAEYNRTNPNRTTSSGDYLKGRVIQQQAAVNALAAELEAETNGNGDFERMRSLKEQMAAAQERLELLQNLANKYGTMETIKERIENWAKRLGVNILALDTPEQVRSVSEIAYQEMQGGSIVESFVTTKANGEDVVCLYIPAFMDKPVDYVDRKVIHEVVSHKGLKALLDVDSFNALCDAVWNMMSDANRTYYMRYQEYMYGSVINHRIAEEKKKDPKKKTFTYEELLTEEQLLNMQRAAADEYMARVSENVKDEERSIWQKIVDSVRLFLAKHNILTTADHDTIESLIRESLNRYLQNNAVAESRAMNEGQSSQAPVEQSESAAAEPVAQQEEQQAPVDPFVQETMDTIDYLEAEGKDSFGYIKGRMDSLDNQITAAQAKSDKLIAEGAELSKIKAVDETIAGLQALKDALMPLYEERKLDYEPQTKEALAANILAHYMKLKNLNKEDVSRELGWGQGERSKFFSVFAPKGKGVTIGAMAEEFMEKNDEYGFPVANDMEARDVIIDVLGSAMTPGDIYNYTKRENQDLRQQAKAELEAAIAAAQAEQEAQAAQEAKEEAERQEADFFSNGDMTAAEPIVLTEEEWDLAQEIAQEDKQTISFFSNGKTEFSKVTNQELINKYFVDSELITGYRNVVLNEDGSFGSPMGSALRGNGATAKTSGFNMNEVEQADEHPELADENGKITLVKPDGKTVDKVDYNPYIHNRPTRVNLQFKQAWERPNLVYIQTEISKKDLDEAYHADKAAKSTGIHNWPSKTSKQQLILSRYDRPVAIVPWEDVADDWAAELKGKGVNFDVVPPALRQHLVDRGVEILPPHKGMGDACNAAYQEWKEQQEEGTRFSFSKSKEEFDANYKKAVEQKGVVMPNLATTEFPIQDVARHDFTGTGNQAIDKARTWAAQNLVGTHKARVGYSDEFEYEINDDLQDGPIGKYLSGSATTKSANLGVHLAVLKELLNVIDKSIEVEYHANYEKEGEVRTDELGDSNLIMHRRYTAVRVDGTVYKVKTSIKEYRNSINEPYTYAVTEIEPPISGPTADDALGDSKFVSGANLLNNVEKSKQRGVKILDASEKTLFSKVTPEQDAEYMKAVESGDMGKAQQMVRDAFKAAFPNNKLVDRSGNPIVVFKSHKPGNTVAGYFTTDAAFAEHYGRADWELGKYFINMENPYEEDFHGADSDGGTGSDGKWRSTVHAQKWAIEAAREKGLPSYDGFILRNVDEYGYKSENALSDDYITRIPGNVKSADPVTYDNEGNVIPLSQRFNPENPDIRFSKIDNVDMKREQLLSTPSIDVTENVIVASNGVSASNAALSWFKSHYPETKYINTAVGKMQIDAESIKDSLSHKYSQRKLDAITSLVEGNERAVYLTSEPDYDGKDQVNHYFVYPINYGGKKCYVLCRSRQDVNMHRLYIHEVFDEEQIKNDTLQSAANQSQPRRGIALYRELLHDVLFGKGSNNSENSKTLFSKAFHGSKADFDKFDHSKMGTGEGAQAHGWGTYVAFNEDTSRGYARKLAGESDFSRISFQIADNESMIEHSKSILDRETAILNSTYANFESYKAFKNKLIDETIEGLKTLSARAQEIIDEFAGKGIVVTPEEVASTSNMELLNKYGAEIIKLKSAIESVGEIEKQIDEAEKEREIYDEAKYDWDKLGFQDRIDAINLRISNLETENEQLRERLKGAQPNRHLYTLEIPNDTGSNYLYEQKHYNKEEADAVLNKLRYANGVIRDMDDIRDKVQESEEFAYLVDFLTRYDDEDNPYIDGGLVKQLRHDSHDFYWGFSIDTWDETLDIDNAIAAARYLDLEIGYGIDQEFFDGIDDYLEVHETISGRRLYNELADMGYADNDKLASLALNKAGFVGIKYDGKIDGKCAVIFNEDDIQIVEHTRFSKIPVTPEVETEMNQIAAVAILNGTYMKAPNGADTKLNAQQWKLVRTKAFKDWFGDWENDPANASKIVDENGEPLVVWHGSRNAGFTEFVSLEEDENGNGTPMWLSTKEWYSHEYSDSWITDEEDYRSVFGEDGLKRLKESEESGMTEDGTYALFANIRNPFDCGNIGDNIDSDTFRDIGERIGMTPEELEKACDRYRSDSAGYIWEITNTPPFAGFITALGYDGIRAVEHDVETYAATNPNQIKSATVNNGEFNPENPDIRFSKKTKTPETASVTSDEAHQPTVVSSASGAKVLKDIDNTIAKYQKKSNTVKTFIGELAEALGATKHGSNSQYATFEAVNGNIITIRLANHNATVSTFDNHDEEDGISIVITAKENLKITNDGKAHVSEFYYNSIKLRKAEGKPLVDILKSIKQALYSGVYEDKTGLAETEEVNTLFSKVTPEQDAAFLEAYTNNDFATARKMVAEAAEAAGYSTVGYHGTVGEVKKFYPNRDGNIFFAVEKEAADAYAIRNNWESDIDANTVHAYLDLGKTAVVDAMENNWEEIGYKFTVSTDDGFEQSFDNYRDALEESLKHKGAYLDTEITDTEGIGRRYQERGYDSVVIENVYDMGNPDIYNGMQTDIILFNPRRIKSAEPFTFDDNNQLIPLSERFNPENDDIRFSFIGTRGGYSLDPQIHKKQIQAMRLDNRGVDPEKIWFMTGWFKAADGKWRYEIDDTDEYKISFDKILEKLPSKYRKEMDDAEELWEKRAARGNIMKAAKRVKDLKLGEVIEYPKLFKAYPELADYNVIFTYSKRGDEGSFNPETKTIEVNSEGYAAQPHSVRMTILHEVQHAIQHIEGFSTGANADVVGKDAYRRSAGEVEARNVENRYAQFYKKPEDRRNSLPTLTEDVARKDQIVKFSKAKESGLRSVLDAPAMTKAMSEIYGDMADGFRRQLAEQLYGSLNINKTIPQFFAGLAEKKEMTPEEIAEANNMRDIIVDAMGGGSMSVADALWVMAQTAYSGKDDLISMAHKAKIAHNTGNLPSQQAAREQAEADIRFSRVQARMGQAAVAYNRNVAYWGNRLHEGYVDMYSSVEELVKAIEEATGKKAESFEDVLKSLNQHSSVALARWQNYDRKFLQPLREAIETLVKDKKNPVDYDGIERYLILKHGVERNEKLAKRDAKKYHERVLAAQLKKGEIDQATYDAELQAKYADIDAGTDSKYQELRANDYSGIMALYSEYSDYGTRLDYNSDEEYNQAKANARHSKYATLMDAENAAMAEVANFEGDHDVKDLWKSINAATKETIKQQYNSGMISREQWQAIRDEFEYYVPLRGFKEDVAEDLYQYYLGPGSGFSAPVLGAKGRKSESESPIAWIHSMASSAIAQNSKNETKHALYYFVANRPDQDLVSIRDTWYVDTGMVDPSGNKIFEAEFPTFNSDLSGDAAKQAYDQWEQHMESLQKQGNAIKKTKNVDLHNTVLRIDEKNIPEHAIRLKVNGRDVTMYVNGNPRAAQAINGNLNMEAKMNGFSEGLAKVLRFIASVNTSYNPEFWISNMQRDLLFAFMNQNVRGKGGAKFLKNLVNPMKVYKMMQNYDAGNTPADQTEVYYQEFAENGGITGFSTVRQNEEWMDEVKHYLDPTVFDKLKNSGAVETFQRFGEAVENMTRFAAYMQARKDGKSIKDAVADAKEISVNFNRKGSGQSITNDEIDKLRNRDGSKLSKAQKAAISIIGNLPGPLRCGYMFFNASVQGLNAMYKAAMANPKKMAAWASGYFALGALQAILHAAMDDDDDYLDMPDYERRNNALIGAKGVYMKWALPQESRVFYALGDIFVNHAMDAMKLGETPREPQENLIWEAMQATMEAMPINPTEGITNASPTLAQLFVQLLLNKDYRGSKIYKDNIYLSEAKADNQPNYSNAYAGTSGTAKKISKILSNLSGGDDEFKAGWINIQPEILDFIFESSFGGVSRFTGRAVKTVIGLIDEGAKAAGLENGIFDQELTMYNVPFLNRIVRINDDRSSRAHTRTVYNYYKDIAETVKMDLDTYSKAGKFDKVEKIMDSDEYQIYIEWESVHDLIDTYNKILKVETDPEERRELMDVQDEYKKEFLKKIRSEKLD